MCWCAQKQVLQDQAPAWTALKHQKWPPFVLHVCSDNVVSPCTNWNKALQMTVWIVLPINMLMWHPYGRRAEKWASMQQCNTHPVPPATRLQYVCECFVCVFSDLHVFGVFFAFIWLREKTRYSWKSFCPERKGVDFFLLEYLEIASCFCLFLLCVTHLCHEGVVVAGSGSTWRRQAAKVNAVSHAPVVRSPNRMKLYLRQSPPPPPVRQEENPPISVVQWISFCEEHSV